MTPANIMDIPTEVLELIFLPMHYENPKALNKVRFVCKRFKNVVDNLPQRKILQVLNLVAATGHSERDDVFELALKRKDLLNLRLMSKSWAAAVNVVLEVNPYHPCLRFKFHEDEQDDLELGDTHNISSLLAPIRTNEEIQNFLMKFESSSAAWSIPGRSLILDEAMFYARVAQRRQFVPNCIPLLTRYGTHLSALTLRCAHVDYLWFTGKFLRQILSSVPNVKRIDWYISLANSPIPRLDRREQDDYNRGMDMLLERVRLEYDGLQMPVLQNLTSLHVTVFSHFGGEICRKLLLWFGPQLEELYLDWDDFTDGSERFYFSYWLESIGDVSFDKLVKLQNRLLHSGFDNDMSALFRALVFPRIQFLSVQIYHQSHQHEDNPAEELHITGHDLVQYISASVGQTLKSLHFKYCLYKQTPPFLVKTEDFVFPHLEELTVYDADFEPGFATNMPSLRQLNIYWASDEPFCVDDDEFALSIWAKAGPSLQRIKIDGYQKFYRPS